MVHGFNLYSLMYIHFFKPLVGGLVDSSIFLETGRSNLL